MTTPRQFTDPTDPNIGSADQQRYAAPEFSSGQVDQTANRGAESTDQRNPTDQRLDDQRLDDQSQPTDQRHHGDPSAGHLSDSTADRQVDSTSQQGTGSAAAAATSGSDAPVGDSLFGERDLSELRSRWNDVQAAFVDDPRACVQKADSLVSSAVEQLTANFSHTRSRLEDQWSRGEEASTEDLRIALKHYRDFFDRILAV